jgi:hypothetical protein
MKFQPEELDFLSAWALEEKSPDPYTLPAHRLQALHRVRGVTLIRLIKAWARIEGRRDEDVLYLSRKAEPAWPWSGDEQLADRLAEIGVEQPA